MHLGRWETMAAQYCGRTKSSTGITASSEGEVYIVLAVISFHEQRRLAGMVS
jgi:hypothetical protein